MRNRSYHHGNTLSNFTPKKQRGQLLFRGETEVGANLSKEEISKEIGLILKKISFKKTAFPRSGTAKPPKELLKFYMNKLLKFCLIGRGSIGTRHLKNLRFLGYSNIIAFTKSKDRTKDQEYFDKYQVRTVHNINEIKDYNPDIFIITNPTSEHVKFANLALDCDSHIFMEKPLSHTLEGVEKLRERIEQQNKFFFQANCLRFHPVIKKIKEIIDDGGFGQIFFVCIHAGSYFPDWHPKEDYRISYAGKKKLGGGVVLTMQHEIDYVYWFLGKFKKIRAFTRKLSGLKIDVEDVASIIMETESGKLVEIHLDFLRRPEKRSIHIQGDKGSVEYKFGDKVLNFYDFEKQKFIKILDLREYDSNQMYVDELKHFIDCLENKKPPLVSIEDAIYTLDTCLKIKQNSL